MKVGLRIEHSDYVAFEKACNEFEIPFENTAEHYVLEVNNPATLFRLGSCMRLIQEVEKINEDLKKFNT